MTSSQKRKSLSKPTQGNQIPLFDLAFVRGRNKNRAHSFLLDIFEQSGFTKAELAQMLGKRPEQITRWLAGPGNLTMDTLGDLIFALKGEFVAVDSVDHLVRGKSNLSQVEWWGADANSWVTINTPARREFFQPKKQTSGQSEMRQVLRNVKNGGGYERVPA